MTDIRGIVKPVLKVARAWVTKRMAWRVYICCAVPGIKIKPKL